MRIMLITDAWEPQVNGVVRTMKRVIEECEAMGHEWDIVSPEDGFFTLPLPTYSEIKLALFAKGEVHKRFEAFQPDAVHIATEGPLGLAGRAMCLKEKHPFTTSYHTRFPEYTAARLPVPLAVGYNYVRWFHQYSGHVMVATPTIRDELIARGFNNVVDWTRGVDLDAYHPRNTITPDTADDPFAGMERPIFLNVGRVAVEKNIEEFLSMPIEAGTKVVVGDGPVRAELEAKYSDAVFFGAKFDDELARCYAGADVFVFPSLTDTFGLVILEAMASGTPVAAYNVAGPCDILTSPEVGSLAAAQNTQSLGEAAHAALSLSPEKARAHAEGYSWTACADKFVENLTPLPVPERKRFWHRMRLRRQKTSYAA